MGAQEVFDKAIEFYDEAMNYIEELSVKARTIAPDFSTNIAKREFDEVLQACLLHVAAADGFITPVEMQFIDKITERGDILLRIKGTFGIQFSWREIQNLSDDILNRLLQMTKRIARSDMEDFAILLPFGDKNGESLKRIMHDLILICGGLSAVDGAIEDCENERTVSIVKELFLDNSVNALKNALEGLQK